MMEYRVPNSYQEGMEGMGIEIVLLCSHDMRIAGNYIEQSLILLAGITRESTSLDLFLGYKCALSQLWRVK